MMGSAGSSTNTPRSHWAAAFPAPTRSHSSVSTARPAFGVSAGSGADAGLLTIPCPAAYPVHQIGASPPEMIIISQRSSSQLRAAPIGICATVSATYSRILVSERTPGQELERQ